MAVRHAVEILNRIFRDSKLGFGAGSRVLVVREWEPLLLACVGLSTWEGRNPNPNPHRAGPSLRCYIPGRR